MARPIIRLPHSCIALTICLALVTPLAISATGAADDSNQQTKPKPPVTLPAPIPIEALDKMPQDATAYCGDGSWSNNGKKEEACASHGGVRFWFGPAPVGTTGRCRDGTYTKARKGTYGACSGNGGVKIWFT